VLIAFCILDDDEQAAALAQTYQSVAVDVHASLQGLDTRIMIEADILRRFAYTRNFGRRGYPGVKDRAPLRGIQQCQHASGRDDFRLESRRHDTARRKTCGEDDDEPVREAHALVTNGPRFVRCPWDRLTFGRIHYRVGRGVHAKRITVRQGNLVAVAVLTHGLL
jgi:hypothetical protein